MNKGPFPPLEQLLPHKHPMIWIDQVSFYEDKVVECTVTVGSQKTPQNEDGTIPNWLGIEYMAQTIGAYVGLISLQRGEPIEIGYLLGTRRSEFFCEAYSPGQCLRIRAQLMGHFDNMGIFDCSIYDGKDQSLLMKGTLKVFRPQAKSPWGFFQERQERDG